MADTEFNLKVIRPVAVTPATVINSNVPETDYPAWAAGNTYALGDRVIVASAHNVYQSAIAGNAGNDPTLAANSDKWALVGKTNRYKAFDSSISSQTKQATSISYQLRLGQVTSSVGLLNLTGATSVRIRVIDPVFGEVYDETYALSAYTVDSDWWTWYFGEWRQPTQAIINDLPNFPNADIYIDIEGGDSLGVGVILLGQLRLFSLGVKMGARVGIQDYSRKERTEFGDVVITERAFAKRANFNLLISAEEVDTLNQFMADVRAVPCLWIGSGRYEAATIYGFYKSYDTVISYYDYSEFDIELEGLT
jgi:hypothetical protein